MKTDSGKTIALNPMLVNNNNNTDIHLVKLRKLFRPIGPVSLPYQYDCFRKNKVNKLMKEWVW